MVDIKIIEGGVCAPKGFMAAGVHCGIRKNKEKKDLALIISEMKASAASVYTQNLVKGAPIYVTKENIKDGYARAILCNSGNANTCNADGMDIANKMCAMVEDAFGIEKSDVIIASTGVIGQPLPLQPIQKGMGMLKANISKSGGDDAAQAILTTDTIKKEISIEFELGGKICKMGGIAKGSGMIHPNMATMLVFIVTDVSITPEMLSRAIKWDVQDTFNMVSVDGDTSTNDMLSILANGAAGNTEIKSENDDYRAFQKALRIVTEYLCKLIAKDGEGATKLLICDVAGAPDELAAKKVAKSIICSNLLKSAMFGADANWGRVLCAIGYSGAAIDVNKIDVSFASQKGEILVCKNGAGVLFSEETAKNILLQPEINIIINLNQGNAKATAWGCDLTYDYVKINGDYRT